MATVLNTLYPPLIDTFMPAFPNTENAVVNFSISPYNSSYEIQYLHVTLVNQKTNKNAFATDSDLETPAGTALVNGVWIIPFAETLNGNTNPYLVLDRNANAYTLFIPPFLLKKNGKENNRYFVIDTYYKVQLRFDKYIESNSDTSSITTWNSDYLAQKRAYFSEWSSVCLLKAIPTITLHLNNFTMDLDDYLRTSNTSITNLPSNFVVPVRTPQYMPGIIPFAGNLTFEGDNDSGISEKINTEYYKRDIKTSSNNEYIMSYRIKIFDDLENLVKDSGIVYPAKTEKTNNFYWLCDLTNAKTNITYSVELTFTTNNQYTFSKTFNFSMIEPSNIDFNPTFSFNKIELPYNGMGYAWKRSDDPYFDNMSAIELSKFKSEIRSDGLWYEVEDEKVLVTSEDGWVTLTVSHGDLVTPGYLFIKRATSLDNFQNWELIDCSYQLYSDNFSRTIVDKTVSSLVSYKYSCQYLTAKGSWTRTVISPEVVYPDFHDILISRGDRQLAIRYNAQITSLTPVVNRVKIDTLGGRYPKFAENAKLHYKQFQLTGLITAESDYNRKFLNDLDYREEMATYDNKIGGRYGIRNDTVKDTGIVTVKYEDEEGNIEEHTYTNGTYSQDISESDTEIKKHKRDTQKNTNHDLYPMDNWWWERKFREEAIEWLNDGEPKLYRSMTEGNLIVMFDAITLTPNIQLGRRIWNLSATIYEVGDGNSLQQLSSLGIYPIVNSYGGTFSDKDGNGDYSLNVDTTISKQQIGQTFEVSAEKSNETPLINTGEKNSPVVYYTNSKNQKLKMSVGSIGEAIGSLYQGLYQNYDFDTSTIRLKDVKIQFNSLPQWYDLTSITPNGTIPGSIYFTITDDDNNEYEVYLKVENNQVIVTKVQDTLTIGRLWALEGKTITEFFNEWENMSPGGTTSVVIDENGKEVYVPRASENILYYKVSPAINLVSGKKYLKEEDIWNNIGQFNDGDFQKNTNVNTSTELWYIMQDNSENYYLAEKRDEAEVELNSKQYIQTSSINLNNRYRYINDQYYYTDNINDLYVKLIENNVPVFVSKDNIELYYKARSLSDNSWTYIPVNDTSNVFVYKWKCNMEDQKDINSKIIQDTSSTTSLIRYDDINLECFSYKTVKEISAENSNGQVYIKQINYFTPISKDEIEDDDKEYYFYFEPEKIWVPLNDYKNATWFLLNVNNNDSVLYQVDKSVEYARTGEGVNDYTPLEDINTFYIKVKNIILNDSEEYFEETVYKEAPLYYHYSTTNNLDELDAWILTSDINLSKYYVNKAESGLPNYQVASAEDISNPLTSKYYQTKIEVSYPEYRYYRLGKDTFILEENLESSTYDQNVYIKIGERYFKKSGIRPSSEIEQAGNNINIISSDGRMININGPDSIEDYLLKWTNYGLGYKLKLNLVSPYDSNVQLERTIFVNEKGYYQVPSNMSVKEITLYDGASATLDYILEYDLKYDDITEPNAYEAAENIVGQISGEWNWNTAIMPLIQAKYWSHDVTEDNSGNKTITEQMLDSWKAVTFEGTPYTILNLRPTSDLATSRYIVGRSGVLNLQTDYPTNLLYVNGKRMVQAPISRQDYLDEWEYVVDGSVYDAINYVPTDGEISNENQFWYIVYNTGTGANIDDWISSDEVGIGIPVIIYLSEEINEDSARDIINGWYELGNTDSITRIEYLEPKPNTVYAIANTAGGFDYKIYYLDEGWFNIEFPNLKKGDVSIAYARVPVYGTIDYRATIMKKLWTNQK